MSKNFRTIASLLLVVVSFSLSYFVAVSILNASPVQEAEVEESVLVKKKTPGAIQVEKIEAEPELEEEATIVPEFPMRSEEAAGDIADHETDHSESSPATDAAIQILTKESFTRWINPLIFLFLVCSFLCWLLALMDLKPAKESRESAKTKTAHSNTSKTENFGRVFATRPAVVDDLTKIGGIDANDARRLNEAGIWQYDQLRNMTAQQRANLQRKLNLPHIRWYSLAGLSGVTAASVATESKNSLTADAVTKADKANASLSANQDSSAIRIDSAPTNGSVRSPKFLGAAGSMAAEKVSPAAGQGSSDLKSDQGLSAASLSSSDSAPVSSSPKFPAGKMDETFGMIYKSPPAQPDDLTRLVGIDAAAATRLNAAGFYKFDQLKELDDRQAALLAEKCQLPDADISDWRRCIYAWGRGIETTAEEDENYAAGLVHGIELPQIADGVYDGGKLVAYPEQVIFRGSNPEGWGRAVGESIDGVETSVSCDSIRSDINYLRIRRTDTRESVVVPMTKGQLFANGDQNENGWNGSSEVFFGGRHIGVFAQHLPQEVETKFSQGGWGFGHRYDHNDRQEWGWAGRVIEPTSFEVSVGCIGDMPGTVVFRGSDPSIWNTRTRDGDSRFADPIDGIKHPVNFVRIMREATGEAVIVRVDGNHILDEGFDPRCGWNGSCSEFSGGQHLGVYHCDLAQDFETRFEFGGWGFGHPYNDNDRQAWGWAGRQLPETVFEISLLELVPNFMQHELVD